MKHKKIGLISLLVMLSILTINISNPKMKDNTVMTKDIVKNKSTYVSYDNYQDWEFLFKKKNYNIDNDKIEIPSLQIKNLPDNIKEIKDIKKRKKFFLSIMLITAHNVNQDLIKDRIKLKEISEQYFKSEKIESTDKHWIESKAKEYNIAAMTIREKINQLFYKLDIIPYSLLLAQAACESGWGTSRFTKVANNLFGEWTYSQEEIGVIPKRRAVNASYKIKKFATVKDSVISYINNLNSNPAYKGLRKIRYQSKEEKQPLNSLKLAEGLINYSEQKSNYVKKVKKIIIYNNLRRFDKLLLNHNDL